MLVRSLLFFPNVKLGAVTTGHEYNYYGPLECDATYLAERYRHFGRIDNHNIRDRRDTLLLS
jgi:hypothetical protein